MCNACIAYFHGFMKSTLLFSFIILSLSFGIQAQTYQQRQQQYIDSVVANDYENAIMIQAFNGAPVNQQRLDDIYDQFDTRSTIDFSLVELVRVIFLSDGQYDTQIEMQMSTLPFWINDGDTLRNFWTENHMIMWMSCEWLMHEKFGWQIEPELKQRLIHYLNLKMDVGFYEYFSSTYFPYTLSGLLNLADFTEDEEIRSKSESVARKLLSGLLIMTNSDGVFYPAAGRNYSGRYDSPYGDTHQAIIYLISGKGPCPSNNVSRADFFATSQIDFSNIESDFIADVDTILSFGHSPEDALYKHDSLHYVDELMMHWSSGMYFHPYIAEESGRLLLDSNFWGHVDFTDLSLLADFPPQQYEAMAIEFDELTVSRTDSKADIAVFKNNQIVLTSLQDYWKGKIGFQQWPIAANVGGTCVYTASGQVEPNWGDRNNSNFNEHLPYIAQEGNVALVMYRPQPVSPFLPYGNKDVALHWRDNDFDSVDENGNWIFGQKDENYIAVRRACVGEINGVRACETEGGQTWVFIIGNDDMYTDYSSFQNLVSQSTFDENWSVNGNQDSTYYASIDFDGSMIEYSWGPEPPFTSVEELSTGDLTTYPNPNNGLFNVLLPESQSHEFEIEVFDALGNMMIRETVGQQSQFNIDLESASDGIYFIRLRSENGIWSGRFMKH